MQIDHFSGINFDRCIDARGFNHPLEAWSLSEWLCAVTGELGEAANIIKKLNRVRDGIPGNGYITPSELNDMLADEIADTYIYLDLLAQAAGINLELAVIKKFNATSEKINYPIKIIS